MSVFSSILLGRNSFFFNKKILRMNRILSFINITIILDYEIQSHIEMPRLSSNSIPRIIKGKQIHHQDQVIYMDLSIFARRSIQSLTYE